MSPFLLGGFSVSQCVAVLCSVLQCGALWCSVLHCAVVRAMCAVCRSVVQCVAVCCSVSQCVAGAPLCVAVCCHVMCLNLCMCKFTHMSVQGSSVWQSKQWPGAFSTNFQTSMFYIFHIYMYACTNYIFIYICIYIYI